MDAKKLQQTVSNALSLVMSDSKHKRRTDPTRLNFLRVSSFPFCGLRWFLDLPALSAKSMTNNFMGAYYTSVGTTYHNVIQASFANMSEMKVIRSRLIGDWECSNQKCKTRYSMQRKPLECTACKGTVFDFREVEIEDGIIRGHIDFILEVEDGKGNVFWVVCDFKTSSIKKVTERRMTSASNKAQLKSYITLLRKRKPQVSPHGFLIYVPRDNPFKLELVSVEAVFSEESEKISYYKSQYKMAAAVAATEDLKELVDNRPCCEKNLKQFSDCKWRGHCAGEEHSKLIFKEAVSVMSRVEHKLPIANGNVSVRRR